ncbi:hypothetical protein TNCV_3766201 [Trichonephila clavipes]|nr:hypothetical protein TNCV_3766201 [Trichonephila clavipes]
MRHVQEEHKMSIKAEQKCLQEVPAQDEMYDEKEETSVDDKSGIDKLAWKLAVCIKRDGTVKIRRSSLERKNRRTRKRVRLTLRTHNNIYRDWKLGKTPKETYATLVCVDEDQALSMKWYMCSPVLEKAGAVGSLVVRASDSRPKGLDSMPVPPWYGAQG